MTIFLFTGPSAVGKSTIANRLGSALKIPILGEREILHDLATTHGYHRTREWLAEAGMEAILDEALKETFRRIGETNTPGVIIDGSY